MPHNTRLEQIRIDWAGHPWDDWLGNGGKLQKAKADIDYLLDRCKKAEALIAAYDDRVLSHVEHWAAIYAAEDIWQQAKAEQEVVP